MKRWLGFCLAVLVGGLVGGAAGCGGESTPSEPSFGDMTNVDKNVALEVGVNVTRSRVVPGETVDIAATVTPVRAEAVRFSWVNVTGHGQLVGTETGTAAGSFAIGWQAPASLESGAVKVEVIQLIVTAISQVISVTDKGVQTSYDIASETKTIPITITTVP
ncbi:hypothetical protein FJZ36_03680 [Candidatus Poribacteria bacterium]|nr:hypothetical protein [Candidatus Poribacteria bacterium]